MKIIHNAYYFKTHRSSLNFSGFTFNPFNATQKNRKMAAAAALFLCSFIRTVFSFSDCCIFFIIRDTETVIA